ncbi:MAG: Acg family FMN-binding oxidoreductase [Actinomycetes bacterium]
MTATAEHIAPALVRQLITAAVAAPSVHNTQPWLFRVDGDCVHVLADSSRQLTAQDPEGRALFMSCGAALLNLRLAAEHYGHTGTVTAFPSDNDPWHIATLDLEGKVQPRAMVDELFAAIPHRHTNRMPYEDRPVPPAVLDALTEAVRQENADLYAVNEPLERRRLVDLIHDADAAQDPQVMAESSRWTGVDDASPDGVPAEALGPLPKDPGTPHRDLAPGRMISGRGFAVFEHDPTLAVLTTTHDDRTAWVTAGQALQRVLLAATVEGLVATFANQPLEAPQLRWLVRDPDQPIGYPQMLFRLGYAPAAPATPRRPIEDVILTS